MAHEFSKEFCNECGKERTFYRTLPNHKLHLILSILTGGLWLVSWLSLIFNQKHLPWTCGACEATKRISHPKKDKIGNELKIEG